MGGLMTKPTPSHNSPVSIGIDFHKRYSVFCVLDAKGGILERGRIEHTTPELFVVKGVSPTYSHIFVKGVSPTYSHIFDFSELSLSSESCLCRTF
jgi:hypothetical protein